MHNFLRIYAFPLVTLAIGCGANVSGNGNPEQRDCSTELRANMAFHVQTPAGQPICGATFDIERDGRTERLAEPVESPTEPCTGDYTFSERSAARYKVTVSKAGHVASSFELEVTHSDDCHADPIDRDVSLATQ